MVSGLFVAHLEKDEKCDDDPDSHITAIGQLRLSSVKMTIVTTLHYIVLFSHSLRSRFVSYVHGYNRYCTYIE